ncbi:hypothetical protein HDV02_005559, partial [Globomyces sp. JEL0801]
MASLNDMFSTRLPSKEIVVSEQIRKEIEQYLTEPLIQCDIYPSTPLQNGLVALTVQNKSAYVNQMKLKFKENLNQDLLLKALVKLTATHEILRTQFVSTSERIYSIVHPTNKIFIQTFTDVEEYCKEDIQKGFEVGDRQWFRCGLHESGSIMVFTIHHVLYDGWSLGSLLNDLFKCYDGNSITTPSSFRNVVEYIESQDKQLNKEFWSEYLKGVETDQGLFGNQVISHINGDFTPIKQIIDVNMNQLKMAATKSKVTLANLTKACWALTLKAYTQKSNIVFGNVVSGRDLPVEGIEEIIGMLINTIPFRVDIDPSQSVQSFLAQIQQSQVRCMQYCQTGLIEIQKWLGIRGQDKLFSTAFIFQNLQDHEPKEEDRYVVIEDGQNILNFNSYDIFIELNPTAKSLICHLEFDPSKVERKMVSRIASTFNCLVSKMANMINDGEIEHAMRSVMILNNAEIQKLINFGTGPKTEIQFKCAHYAFEEIARTMPHLIAVEHENRSITYGKLNERAEEIACILMNRGVSVGSYIGLVTIRSIEMICGIFGILKAGGAYIPIDHELPLERIQNILQITKCSTIMYHPDVRQEVYAGLDHSKCVSLTESGVYHNFTPPIIPSDSPAYVVFTSGSTGRPKGVVTSHKSLQSLVTVNYFDIVVGKKLAQVASISFDVCVSDVFFALSHSGVLVLRSSDNYFSAIKKSDCVDITPTALLQMSPSNYPNLKAVMVGGE